MRYGIMKRILIFRDYRISYILPDILSGIIVALVSIPIAMGYAQVAGLPPEYGLYGSLLPILVFGFMTSSKRFVFGIDAASSALVGGLIASLGIETGTLAAMHIVPVVTLAIALWLLLFYFLQAGRLVKFISTPVMGGFISGIGSLIIMMQIPKLFGGSSGNGELIELSRHIFNQLTRHFNLVSCIMGVGTVVIVRLCRKYVPKIPMAVIMMFAGAGSSYFLHIEKFNVALLPDVKPGLPHLILPDFAAAMPYIGTIIISSFTVALVIVAETLLATTEYALKYDEKVDSSRELLAYAVGNAVSALSGCGPVSGSVSRTGMACQFGVKSQLMSIVACISMGCVLIWGTGIIGYLPVPVLTGIVIAALMNILEFGLAEKLRRADRVEWLIFWAAFMCVMFFGTIYGVLVGMMLSLITVVIRASAPSRDFLGCIAGHAGFYEMKQRGDARPVSGIIMYRFSAQLFFANVTQLQEDIDGAVRADTKAVIIDTGGVGSIDVTAAEKLLVMYRKYREKGIRFCLAGHGAAVDDQLCTFGAGEMITDGAVYKSISAALYAMGITKPYDLVPDYKDSVTES